MFASPTTWMTVLGDVSLTTATEPISGMPVMGAIAALLLIGVGFLVADARREAKAATPRRTAAPSRRLRLVPA